MKKIILVLIIFIMLMILHYRPRDYTNLTIYTLSYPDIAVDMSYLSLVRGQISYTEWAGEGQEEKEWKELRAQRQKRKSIK